MLGVLLLSSFLLLFRSMPMLRQLLPTTGYIGGKLVLGPDHWFGCVDLFVPFQLRSTHHPSQPLLSVTVITGNVQLKNSSELCVDCWYQHTCVLPSSFVRCCKTRSVCPGECVRGEWVQPVSYFVTKAERCHWYHWRTWCFWRGQTVSLLKRQKSLKKNRVFSRRKNLIG